MEHSGRKKRKRGGEDDDGDTRQHQRLKMAGSSEPANSLVRISPGFLSKITTDTIRAQIEEVEHASAGPRIASKMMTARTNILQAISSKTPISNNTVALLTEYQKAVAQSSCGKWTDQAEHLLLNMLLWDWIETMVSEGWEQVERDDDELAGIALLLKDLSAGRNLELRSTTYFADLSDQTYAVPSAPKKRTTFHILQQAIKIMANWLSLPKDFVHYQARSWFIKEVLCHIGPQGLRLSDLLKASDQVRVSVLGLSRNVSITHRHLIYWSKHYLQRHALYDASSEERKALMDLCALVDKVSPLDEVLLAHALEASDHHLVDTALLDTLSLPPLPVFSTPDIFQEPEMFEQFWKFVYTSLQIISPNFQPPSASSTLKKAITSQEKSWIHHARFLQHVSANLDSCLPFRDQTPSQMKILSGVGPYSEEHVETVGGLFSALLYRGITHGGLHLQNHPDTVFPTLDDWTTLRDTLLTTNPKTYILNVSSYGINSRHRDLKHAAAYWKIANNKTYNSWLLEAAEPIDVVKLFRLLQEAHIPGLGGGFLLLELVFDYARCGRVTKPSADELQTLYSLAKIERGAVKRVKDLGFDKISVGLTAVLDELNRRMLPEMWKVIDMDFIVLSHALRAWDAVDTKICRQFLEEPFC